MIGNAICYYNWWCNCNTSWFPKEGGFGKRWLWWIRAQEKLWELERMPSFRGNCHRRLKMGDMNELWVLGGEVWDCSCSQASWLCNGYLWNRLCSFLGSEFKVARASGLKHYEVYGLCSGAKEKALIEGSRTCYLPVLFSTLPLTCCVTLHKSVPPSVLSIFIAVFFVPGLGYVSVCSS